MKGHRLKTGRNVLRRGRTLLAGSLLPCLLVSLLGAPAAQAAFTGRASAEMPVSTFVLAAPAGNTTTDKCSPTSDRDKHWLRIAVKRHGTVPRATHYVLKVYKPSGALQETIDLGTDGSYESHSATGGLWSYSIEAQYRVAPGSKNVWTSNAQRQGIYC